MAPALGLGLVEDDVNPRVGGGPGRPSTCTRGAGTPRSFLLRRHGYLWTCPRLNKRNQRRLAALKAIYLNYSLGNMRYLAHYTAGSQEMCCPAGSGRAAAGAGQETGGNTGLEVNAHTPIPSVPPVFADRATSPRPTPDHEGYQCTTQVIEDAAEEGGQGEREKQSRTDSRQEQGNNPAIVRLRAGRVWLLPLDMIRPPLLGLLLLLG